MSKLKITGIEEHTQNFGSMKKYYGIRGGIYFIQETNRYWKNGGNVIILRNKNYKKIAEMDENDIEYLQPEIIP